MNLGRDTVKNTTKTVAILQQTDLNWIFRKVKIGSDLIKIM